MIKVTVELMSAISRDRDRVLGVMMIDNVTTAEDIAEKQGKSCDYHGEIRRAPEFVKATRHAVVEKYRRNDYVIWVLVRKMLAAMGY